MQRSPGGWRRGAGSMRVSAGSHGVGKALDGELAQLVRRAGLTSAQTDAVIPAGTAPSLAARVRRNPNSAVTPPPPDAAFPFQNQTHAKPLHRVSRAHRCAFRVFEKGAKAHNMGIYQVRGISMCETLNRTGYETLTGPDMRLWPDRAVGRRARKFARVAKRQ
jgi:hypothetical protein